MNTSVDLTLTDHVSSVARGISDELEKVAGSADKINSAFNPVDMERYTKELSKLTEEFSKLYKHQNDNLPGTSGTRELPWAKKIQGATGQVGGALTSVTGGDVLGGAKGLSSLLGIAGPAGALAAIGIGGAVVTDKLADQYSQRAEPGAELASMQGQLTSNLTKNNILLDEAIGDVVDTFSKYGKTFEEGYQAQRAYLATGGRSLERSEAGAYAMAYKGENMAELAAFEGLLSRYGQFGGLSETRAVQQAQGLSPALFGEVMGGIEDVFTSYLNRGIVKDTDQIARDAEYLSGAGATFQGGLGFQKLQGLNQVVAGAGNLQSQEDMIFFQAGQQIATERMQKSGELDEGQTAGLWETKKLLETEGFSAEMFGALREQYEKLGYADTQAMMSFQKATGLSATETEQVFNLSGEGKSEELDNLLKEKLPEGTGKTNETLITNASEQIKQAMIDAFAKPAYEIKTTAMDEAVTRIADGIDSFSGGLENIGDDVKAIAGVITGDKSTGEKAKELVGIAAKPIVENILNPDGLSRTEQAQNFRATVEEEGYFGGVRNADIVMDRIGQAEAKGFTIEQIYDAVGLRYQAARARGTESGVSIGENELQGMLDALNILIKKTDENTEAVKNSPIYVTGSVSIE